MGFRVVEENANAAFPGYSAASLSFLGEAQQATVC